MRQLATCMAVVLLSIVLPGCPFDAKVPLGIPLQRAIDDRLTGYWVLDDAKGAATPMLLWVARFNDIEIYAEQTGSGDRPPDRFRAVQVEIGGQIFWDLSEVGASFPMALHLLARSTLTPDGRLSLIFVGKEGVASGLDSDAAGLRAYLAAHLNDSTLDDKDGAYVWRRPKYGEVDYGRLKSSMAPLQACPGMYDAATWTSCVGEWGFQNGAKYTGAWKDGERSGQGTEVFPSGETYIGEWKDGERNGQGTVAFASGAIYAGEWRGGDFTGQGSEMTRGGHSYVGEWKDFKRHGQGTATSPNGAKYVGAFKDGDFSGQGTLISPDGRKYSGEFKDGHRHGQGTVTYPDGMKFVGEFRNNESTGQGIEYGADGRVQRSGAWKNGFFLDGQHASADAKMPIRSKPDPKAQAGAVFRDCEGCPEMVTIAAGGFLMGSAAAEEDRSANEGPQHRVSIARPFAAGRYEITFDEWDACIRERGCSHIPKTYGWGRGRRPVIDVSWQDAKQYAMWLSRKTGKRYRLLTEAEWEYVARAGTSTAFSTGSVVSMQQARYSETPEQTALVGSFGANAFGLFDVHGNVWEWTEDCRNASYAGAPANGAAWLLGDCTQRMGRGGFWGSDMQDLRSAARESNPSGGRYSGAGFRLARTLDQ